MVVLFLCLAAQGASAQAQEQPPEAPEPAPQEEGRLDDDLNLGALLDAPVEVWTASKSEENIHQAPAIVTTVTREQIAIWGYRSVAEVLAHLLGFYPVDDHVTPNLAVRGISGGPGAESSIVKVLIDGHSVAFQSTAGNWLGPELVPLSAVERIEVVRGPASSLFGADAFLGVVNIKTRSGASLGGPEARLQGGLVGREPAGDVDLALGGRLGGVDLLLAARHQRQDLSGLELPESSPAPSIPQYNFGQRTAHGLFQRSTSVLGRAGLRPRPATSIGAFAYFSALDRGAEFGSLYQLANGTNAQGIASENRVVAAQARAGLVWDEDLTRSLRLTSRASGFRGRPGRDSRIEVGSDYYYVRRSYGFWGGELESQLEWKPRFASSSRLRGSRIVAGASASLDRERLPSRLAISKQETKSGAHRGDVLPEISIQQGQRSFVNLGAYLQGTLAALSEQLSLNGGLRYDHHSVYGGQLSQRLGVVANPSATLHFKLLYGSAFKAPSPLLLHAVPSAIGDVEGNPDLKPQFVRTLELFVDWEAHPALELASGVAVNRLTDKTEFVQQGISRVARNVAQATTVSWESKAELKYKRMLRSYLSVELQKTVRRTAPEGYVAEVVGAESGIYPNLLVHAGTVVQPANLPVRGMAQASFIGRRRPSDGNIVVNGGAYSMPGYLLLEAGLSSVGFHPLGSARHELSLGLYGKNLLGSTGPAPGFSGVDYPLAPRSFFLELNLAY
jgi:iron complex outermembrane receptor protein